MVRPRHFSHNLVNRFFQILGQISTPKIRNAKKCCRFFTFLTTFRHFSSLIKIAQRGIFLKKFKKTLKIVKTSQNMNFSLYLVFPLLLSCSRFFYTFYLFLVFPCIFPYYRFLGFRLSAAPPDHPFNSLQPPLNSSSCPLLLCVILVLVCEDFFCVARFSYTAFLDFVLPCIFHTTVT